MTITRQPASLADREKWTTIRSTLERERAELLADLELVTDGPPEPTATTGPGETEHISSGIEQGLQAALDARAFARLSDISDALRRLDEGGYGQCEQCGSDIPVARLEAIPHARLCLACQHDQDVDLRGRRHR